MDGVDALAFAFCSHDAARAAAGAPYTMADAEVN